MRQIILDTETTGLKVEDGHRIIEIGCLEMIDRRLTGQSFHRFINPERDIEAGALAVHGITNESLQNKPLFKDIAQEFIAFVQDAELIIHNAPFDIAFLNQELKLAPQSFKSMTNYCRVMDTLQLARKLHAGQRNSLDALCKRYSVDNSKRDLHGALVDAHLLAQVYLAMTGGQGSFFDEVEETQKNTHEQHEATDATLTKRYQLIVLPADETELTAHLNYIQTMKKQGSCKWVDMLAI